MIILYYTRNYKWHVVQPGESLYKLAHQYKTTAQAIVLANPWIDPNYLYIGQQIRIPDPAPFNQISMYQERRDIPAPEELYVKIKTDEKNRGVQEVITDLFDWYSKIHDKFMTSFTQTNELQTKIAEYSNIVNSFMLTPTQNISIDNLLSTRKEIEALAEEALKIQEANKGMVFFISNIAPFIDKFFNYIPIANELAFWVKKMIEAIETGGTPKISEVVNRSAKLLNDISSKIAQKYVSLGVEEEANKMEENRKELEKSKQDVIDDFEKHKAESRAECEELKIKYDKHLEESKAIKPTEPETAEIPTPSELPEIPSKIIGSTTITGNYPSDSTFWAYFSFAVDLDFYSNGTIQENLRVHFNKSMWKQIAITIKFDTLERSQIDTGYSRIYIPSSFSWNGIDIYDRPGYGEYANLRSNIRFLDNELMEGVEIKLVNEILEFNHPEGTHM